MTAVCTYLDLNIKVLNGRFITDIYSKMVALTNSVQPSTHRQQHTFKANIGSLQLARYVVITKILFTHPKNSQLYYANKGYVYIPKTR